MLRNSIIFCLFFYLIFGLSFLLNADEATSSIIPQSNSYYKIKMEPFQLIAPNNNNNNNNNNGLNTKKADVYNFNEPAFSSIHYAKPLKDNYFKIKIGIVQPTALDGNSGLTTGKTTYTAGATIGRKFYNLISTDLEYMYKAKSTCQNFTPGQTSSTPTSWASTSNTVMLNIGVDLISNSNTTPYLRGGAGLSINKADTYILSEAEAVEPFNFEGKTTKNFSWQVGCGVNFNSTSIFSIELEYMFVNRGTILTEAYYTTASDSNKVDHSAIKGDSLDHVITVGSKIRF